MGWAARGHDIYLEINQMRTSGWGQLGKAAARLKKALAFHTASAAGVK